MSSMSYEDAFREERRLCSEEADGAADEMEEWDAALADGLD